MSQKTAREKLHDTLLAYEGCVNECEREGDDSDEAIEALRVSREALMDVLIEARG